MKNKKMLYGSISVALIIIMAIGVFLIGDKIKFDFSLDQLRLWIDGKRFSEVLFIGLWSLRLLLFIPGVTLMLLGGLIFEPYKAFVLSLAGIVISDTLVFLLAKSTLLSKLRIKLSTKYPEIIELIETYSYKILGIGVLCPIAPTDVIVFLSSYVGMKFSKFLIIFITANIPALLLHSYLGESFEGSMTNTIFMILTLIISSVLSIRLWNDLRRRLPVES